MLPCFQMVDIRILLLFIRYTICLRVRTYSSFTSFLHLAKFCLFPSRSRRFSWHQRLSFASFRYTSLTQILFYRDGLLLNEVKSENVSLQDQISSSIAWNTDADQNTGSVFSFKLVISPSALRRETSAFLVKRAERSISFYLFRGRLFDRASLISVI